MNRLNWSVVRGTVAVLICTLIACFWGFWGAVENFHEGWYWRSLGANLALAICQYWCWPICFSLFAVVGVYKPRLGAGLFAGAGILINALLFNFQNPAGIVLILIPCLMLAALFYAGTVPKRRLASLIVLGLPVLLMIVVSAPLAWKVSHRLTDISETSLKWSTGTETLLWAPPGPGWPKVGETYKEAVDTCAHLSIDGMALSPKAMHVWRLPTIQEAERALNRGGKPAGCRYSGRPGFQPCAVEADKEAPLWDPFIQVIYWWTGTDDSRGQNLRIAYNGYVLPVRKSPTGYTGFRAVKTFQEGPQHLP